MGSYSKEQINQMEELEKIVSSENREKTTKTS